MVPTIKLHPVMLRNTPRLPYKPLPYQPALSSIQRPTLGQTGAITAMGVVPMLGLAALGAGGAYLAFNWASKSKGVPAVIGYILGAIGSLWALSGVVGALFWGTMVHAGASIQEQQKKESEEFFKRSEDTWQQMQQQRTTQESLPLPATPSFPPPYAPPTMIPPAPEAY